MSKPAQYGYVDVPMVSLRDRVAPVYNKMGVVKNAERVEILETSSNKRYVRVKSPRGEQGWMEARYLVDQSTYDQFRNLAAQNAGAPTQAMATARHETNLHVEPARDSDHLYLLPEGDKLQLLQRASAERPASMTPTAAAPSKPGEPPPAPPREDWWLVRDATGHTGWVLARMVDEDVPLDVAQYAEGQRIVAYFVLNQVQDGDKQVPQYLMLLTEPKDGLPYDFNQVRVFTWNLKKHRYETAYRDRELYGMLPATVGQKDFGDRSGPLPFFTVRLQDDAGQVQPVTYKLDGVMVKRVLAPGEQPPPRHHRERRTAEKRAERRPKHPAR